MTNDELRVVLDRLGIPQTRFARFIGANERTARRYTSGQLPLPVAEARLLRLMMKHGETVEAVEALDEIAIGGGVVTAKIGRPRLSVLEPPKAKRPRGRPPKVRTAAATETAAEATKVHL